MSVESALGLDPHLTDLLAEAWPRWTADHPDLARVPDPVRLREWLRVVPAVQSDPVLSGLVSLASVYAGDDTLAAQALAWAFLPAATHLAHRLNTLTDDIDELVAAELWTRVRTYPLARSRVSANLSRDLRKHVVKAHAQLRGSRSDTALAWLSESELIDRTLVREPSALDELVDVLDAACDRGSITPRDRQLLLTLVDAANDFPTRNRSGLGLLSDACAAEAAHRLGMSERTVKRHARLALDALTQDAAPCRRPA